MNHRYISFGIIILIVVVVSFFFQEPSEDVVHKERGELDYQEEMKNLEYEVTDLHTKIARLEWENEGLEEQLERLGNALNSIYEDNFSIAASINTVDAFLSTTNAEEALDFFVSDTEISLQEEDIHKIYFTEGHRYILYRFDYSPVPKQLQGFSNIDANTVYLYYVLGTGEVEGMYGYWSFELIEEDGWKIKNIFQG